MGSLRIGFPLWKLYLARVQGLRVDPRSMDRREFLRIAATLGLGAAVGVGTTFGQSGATRGGYLYRLVPLRPNASQRTRDFCNRAVFRDIESAVRAIRSRNTPLRVERVG